MKIDFEGCVWEIDLDEIDMLQGDLIATYTGLSVMGWYKSLLDTDNVAWNKSVRCLYWLMREQNPQNGGRDGTAPASLNFAPVKLFAAFADAQTASTSAVEVAEPDPTKPAAEPGGEDSTPPQTPAG